jgi:hypothetical protein
LEEQEPNDINEGGNQSGSNSNNNNNNNNNSRSKANRPRGFKARLKPLLWFLAIAFVYNLLLRLVFPSLVPVVRVSNTVLATHHTA